MAFIMASYPKRDYCTIREKTNQLCLDLEAILFNEGRYTKPDKKSRDEKRRAVMKELWQLKENYLKEIDASTYQDEEITRLDEENEALKKERIEVYDDHRRSLNRLNDYIDDVKKKHEDERDDTMQQLHKEKVNYCELEAMYLALKDEYDTLQKKYDVECNNSNKKQKTSSQ